MFGSFGNTSDNTGIEAFRGRPHPGAALKHAKKPEHHLNQLIEHEWSELPYAMMRLTATRRPWDANRIYWRDRNVQLGEIDLHLRKSRAAQNAGYIAAYSHEELRRDFSLHPSLDGDQVRWSAPGVSEVHLTTGQLAEKLLSQLVSFYTSGLA